MNNRPTRYLSQPKCPPAAKTIIIIKQPRKVLQLLQICGVLERNPNLMQMLQRWEGVRELLPRIGKMQEPLVRGNRSNPPPGHGRRLLPPYLRGKSHHCNGAGCTRPRADTTRPQLGQLGYGGPLHHLT
jgi:hypothetical protein